MRLQAFTAIALIGTLLAGAMPLSADSPNYYNGVSSVIEANKYDAPIWRQFAFAEGRLTQYHVLSPELLLIDDAKSQIYQFPMCDTLAPVLPDVHAAVMPDGQVKMVDAPTRQIVDVVLATGCSVQPKAVAEVEALALQMVVRPLWVNAMLIPESVQELSDTQLFNAPPFRPRIPTFVSGEPRVFITYEASWLPTWTGTAFPNEADVFMLTYGPLFRPGFTILNVAAGTPNGPESMRLYSPIWRANCMVDADDQKCMLSVNMKDQPYDPETGLGYWQCRDLDECKSMRNYNGKAIVIKEANTFTHINCPMVAVDLDGDDFIGSHEELYFPPLWVDGPVIV